MAPITQDTNHFQRHRDQINNVFDIVYYKSLKTYLVLLGINPNNQGVGSTCKLTIVTMTLATGMIPLILQLYKAIIEKDLDEAFEEVPHICVICVCLTKYLNIVINRHHFKVLFDSILEDWETFTNELPVLDKVTKQGSVLAYLYRSLLLTFLVIFLFVPLIPVALDVILPLNETRTRHQIMKANYMIIDQDDYFFIIYCHLGWLSVVCVLTVVVIDLVFIQLIHHNSALFDVCGYQIEMEKIDGIANPKDAVMAKYITKKFGRYISTHHKALRFYSSIDECCGTMNLLQIGFGMISLSITAVQVILYMSRPAEALRFALFLIAQKIHLFVMSFIGQVLLNHTTMLRATLYNSNWYDTPVQLQKLLLTMQIRCSKPCILTAGGLYNMNIETFGVTVKACMSYFTMFLSLRE